MKKFVKIWIFIFIVVGVIGLIIGNPFNSLEQGITGRVVQREMIGGGDLLEEEIEGMLSRSVVGLEDVQLSSTIYPKNNKISLSADPVKLTVNNKVIKSPHSQTNNPQHLPKT